MSQRAQSLQCWTKFSAGSERMFVHQQHVRLERFHGAEQQPGAQVPNGVRGDAQVAGTVGFVGQFAQTREFENLHPVGNSQPGHIVGAAGHEYRGVGRELRQSAGNREVAAGVAQAKTVVGVEQEAHGRTRRGCEPPLQIWGDPGGGSFVSGEDRHSSPFGSRHARLRKVPKV